ncbi:MAG: hypothetical protein J3K34DRAFT_100320 [Monoraphidium minutum]|nr:MAG: hypothetical protein J3K34DRAFT_100320 [Monoraphidium minutum]
MCAAACLLGRPHTPCVAPLLTAPCTPCLPHPAPLPTPPCTRHRNRCSSQPFFWSQPYAPCRAALAEMRRGARESDTSAMRAVTKQAVGEKLPPAAGGALGRAGRRPAACGQCVRQGSSGGWLWKTGQEQVRRWLRPQEAARVESCIERRAQRGAPRRRVGLCAARPLGWGSAGAPRARAAEGVRRVGVGSSPVFFG